MIRITDFKINDIKEILKQNIGKFEYIILDYNQFVSDLLKRECIFFYVVVPSHGLISVLSNNQNENNNDLTKYKNRVSIRNGKNSDTSKIDNLTKLTNKINCEKQYGFVRLSTDISDIILFLKEFKKQIDFDNSIVDIVSDMNERNYMFSKFVFDKVNVDIDVKK
jgi:hypothetical protein